MKTILLVGIPGAGKSSILQEVVRQIPTVQVINYGDKMLEEAASDGITRDLLRKMPLKQQQQIGAAAAKKMVQQKTDSVVIIDTHALIRTSTGYCPGLPREVLEILSPTAYALVDCLSHIILERRQKDLSRARDEETTEDLQMHQGLTRSFLTACSMHTGSLLCYIQNNNAPVSQNALPLIRLIQSMSP